MILNLIKKALFIFIKLCTETCMSLLLDATTIKLQFIKGDIFIKVSCFQNEFFFIMDCISIFTFMYLSTKYRFFKYLICKLQKMLRKESSFHTKIIL